MNIDSYFSVVVSFASFQCSWQKLYMSFVRAISDPKRWLKGKHDRAMDLSLAEMVGK